MTSPKCSQFDFEVLYKQHVHDNLLLNDGLRSLDSLKKSKLRELEKNKAAFKKKFSKYNAREPQKYAASRYLGDVTPRAASSKPSFVVCKNSPLSMKSWHNLTDVYKEGIDIYKTDVLNSEEEAVSFRREDQDKSDLIRSSASDENIHSRKVISPIARNKSCDPHTLLDNTDSEYRVLSGYRQRANTMHSYSYQRKPQIVCKLQDKEAGDVSMNGNKVQHVSADTSKKSPEMMQTPLIEITKIDNDCQEVGEKSDEFHNIDVTNKDGSCYSPEGDKLRSLQRTHSMYLVPTHQKLNNEKFRQRSYTIHGDKVKQRDNVELRGQRKLLPRRESLSHSKIDSFRRMSLFERLVSSSLSSLVNTSNSDLNYDDIRKSRYLRVPGESVHGSQEVLSLEHVDF